MKKTLLSILLSLSCIITYGQITVTHMDMMFVGDEYFLGKDDNPAIILGTSGANKIWNFSFLNAIDQDTVSIVSPSGSLIPGLFSITTLTWKLGNMF